MNVSIEAVKRSVPVLLALLGTLFAFSAPGGSSYHVGHRVWQDLNRNGIQDPNEPGMNGVIVKAYRAADNQLLDTQVSHNNGDSDGIYSFSFDSSASVYLVFEPPKDFLFTARNQGADDQLDSDADPLTGKTELIRFDPMKPASRIQGQWDAGLVAKLYEQTAVRGH